MNPINMVLPRGGLRGLMRAGSVACVLLALAAPATAASWLEKNFYLSGPRYDAVLPACDAASAVGKIVGRFAVKESRFWNSSLTIQDVSAIREVSFRPWMESTVPRRFCTSKVLVSDGRWRTMHYSIVEDGGMIGASWGVEWCVIGLDRNWAYNPNCKMALP
jgi:hypothetical protein